MEIHLTTRRPVAYVREVREEEVEGVMHQFCEPQYGVVAEGSRRPFAVGTALQTLVRRALQKGFQVLWSH